MAPDVAPIERLAEHALVVDPKAIEGEFDRIWQETAGPGTDESTVRVRVMNLVALATGPDADQRFEAVMQRLPEHHPCRGFLVVAAEEHDRLGAVISAHCLRGVGGRAHVCSEEVLLTGASSQHRELASAILALLVPDLPVVLWLMDESAASGRVAERLLDAADSVIFDSARLSEPQAAMQLAARFGDEHELLRYDLAWGRLSAWRSLIAQLFDGADGQREMEQIQSIEVSASGGAHSNEALLLASWLTTRTGLALADARIDGDRLGASFYDGTREVRLAISPDTDTGGIRRARIRTSDADFAIERHAQSGHLHVIENWDSGSTRRVVESAPVDEASVIELALDGGMSPGVVYEESLRMGLSLAG